MAMTILNNTASMMTLGELNKNITKVGKDLRKLSTGERLPNVGAGASDYAVSEKMRAQIRALSQDIRNVQNGQSLINVASGGANDIVDELRALKELALNSCNDHNTDEDRKILQKEFDARKAHIDDVARETNYNGIVLLDGRWKRIIPGGGFETKERLISEQVERNVTQTPGATSTIGPTTIIKTPTPTVRQTSSSSTYTTTTSVQPSHTESTPVVTTTNSSNSYQEGPATTTVSSEKTSEEPIVTKEGKRRTVITNDTITSQKMTTTSDVQTYTTTTTTQKTITDVAVKDISTTTTGSPTILPNGMPYITADGVYELAPDYTGTIMVMAQNVQIQGPSNGATLTDVYIQDMGVQDLYIKNLNIKNTQDKNTIAFDSSSANTLHILGNNYFDTFTNDNFGYCAVVYAGGGLSMVGNGTLSIDLSTEMLRRTQSGAVIGSNANGGGETSCGDINIGQQVKINIRTVKNTAPGGAAIGSSSGGSCGDITIGKDAKINLSIYNSSSPSLSNGAGIGCGTGGQCGDITIYSGANITSSTAHGAGIGTGRNRLTPSQAGNITVYSDVKMNISTEEGACIGSGGFVIGTEDKIGTITVYSYPNSNLKLNPGTSADAVGYGEGSNADIEAINLLSDYNRVEGGTLDNSELPLPTITNPNYEVTTTVTDEVTTAPIITETRTTVNEPFEEVENIITTSVYEEYEEEIPDKPGNPLIIHTGQKANRNKPIYIEDMRLEALGIKSTKIEPMENAKKSLDIIDAAIDYALDQATSLGAYSTGLSFTENNLTSAHEMTSNAESVIRDADMAKEMTSFTKNNILMQSAQAMMSQANQQSSSILNLLQ